MKNKTNFFKQYLLHPRTVGAIKASGTELTYKMLDLCNILDANVNELLNGEKINMKDYEKKTNELLVELAIQEELKNKKMITSLFVLCIPTVLFYIAITLLAAYTLGEWTLFGIIVLVSTIVLVLVAFYALKLEIEAGYYECKCCHHKLFQTLIRKLW